MKMQILPSLLAADFGRLADEILRAEASGAEEDGDGIVVEMSEIRNMTRLLSFAEKRVYHWRRWIILINAAEEIRMFMT